MRLVRWGWNLAVRRERWARQIIRMGREADLHVYLADQVLERKPVGRRIVKVRELMLQDGLTEEQATCKLSQAQIAAAWKRSGSGLSVEYAAAVTDAAKQSMVGSMIGSAWAKLTSDKGKLAVAWKACWEGIRGAPRKNKDFSHGWLAMQIQGSNPIVNAQPNEYGDNVVAVQKNPELRRNG